MKKAPKKEEKNSKKSWWWWVIAFLGLLLILWNWLFPKNKPTKVTTASLPSPKNTPSYSSPVIVGGEFVPEEFDDSFNIGQETT